MATAEVVHDEASGTMKGRILEGFGDRLTRLRKGCGLTQDDLGTRVGLSRRMIAYYESQRAQPPGPLLPDIAKALGVSIDQLLGVKPTKATTSAKTARLMNRLRRIQDLPPADQRIVLGTLEALLSKNANGKRTRRRQAVGS